MNRALRDLISVALATLALPAADLPPWEEVIGIVRSNFAGVTEIELNDATIRGLLQQFPSRLILETETPTAAAVAPEPSPLARTQLFETAFAYLRAGRVAAGLADAVRAALTDLQATSRVQGVLFDLRFAGGEDFAEAGRTADLFVSQEPPQTLLDWGTGTVQSTVKTNACSLPLAILINGETRGAAEALAATLHGLRLGLLIGAPTAGQASVFKEFTLSTGQRLRVAVAPVKVSGDTPVPTAGLTPDIAVVVPAAEEREYLADPFKPGPNASLTASRAARLTEADLVRLHREATDPAALRPRRSAAPPPPSVTDPALLRALDLLKGLAVVGLRQP